MLKFCSGTAAALVDGDGVEVDEKPIRSDCSGMKDTFFFFPSFFILFLFYTVFMFLVLAAGEGQRDTRRNVAEADEIMSYAASLREIWAQQNQAPFLSGPTSPLRMPISNPSADASPQRPWGHTAWHTLLHLLNPASRILPHDDRPLRVPEPLDSTIHHADFPNIVPLQGLQAQSTMFGAPPSCYMNEGPYRSQQCGNDLRIDIHPTWLSSARGMSTSAQMRGHGRLRRPVAEACEHRAESEDIKLSLLPRSDALSNADAADDLTSGLPSYEARELSPTAGRTAFDSIYTSDVVSGSGQAPREYQGIAPDDAASPQRLTAAVSGAADEVHWWSRNEVWESRPVTRAAKSDPFPDDADTQQNDRMMRLPADDSQGYVNHSSGLIMGEVIHPDDVTSSIVGEAIQTDDAISSIIDDLLSSTLHPSPRFDNAHANPWPQEVRLEPSLGVDALVEPGSGKQGTDDNALNVDSYDWLVSHTRKAVPKNSALSPRNVDLQGETASLLGFQSPLTKSSSKHFEADEAASGQLPWQPSQAILPSAGSPQPVGVLIPDIQPSLEQVIVQLADRSVPIGRKPQNPVQRGVTFLQRPLLQGDGQLPGQLPEGLHSPAPSRFLRQQQYPQPQQQHPQQSLLANEPSPHLAGSTVGSHGMTHEGRSSKWPWRRKKHPSAVGPSDPMDVPTVPETQHGQVPGWAARRGFERLDSFKLDQPAAGPLSDAADAAAPEEDKRPGLLERILSNRSSINYGPDYQRHR